MSEQMNNDYEGVGSYKRYTEGAIGLFTGLLGSSDSTDEDSGGGNE